MSLQVTTLPMQEDTTALIQVFPETEQNGTIRFLNGSGAVINDRTFIIDSSGKWSGVVTGGPIANGAYGDIQVYEGIHCQVDDLVSGENTFATVGQPVYYKNSTGEWSDTWTVGYYLVGLLYTAKDAAGVIVFEKYRYAQLQVTVGTVVAPGEIGWLTFDVTADAFTAALSNDYGFNFNILDAFVISTDTITSATLQLLDSSDNAISDAMIIAVETTVVRVATIDGVTNNYNEIADGIVKFLTASTVDRGTAWILVQGVV